MPHRTINGPHLPAEQCGMISTPNHLPVAIFGIALGLTAALTLGFFGDMHPALDSLSHFRIHLAVALGLAALGLMTIRFAKAGAVALLVSILAMATTSGSVPWLGMKYGALHPNDSSSATYTLLHLNLLYDNPTPERVLSLIGRLNPDVVTLNEVSAMWREKLSLIRATYRFQINCSIGNSRSAVAIVSRRPFVEGSTPFCAKAGTLAMARISFGGQVVDVAAVHPGWPWPFEQSRQIDRLSPLLAKLGDSAIVAGDLNATPWSYATKRIAQAAGAELMRSPRSTWLPTFLPPSWILAGLPIDQVFAKGNILVQSVAALEPVGSDHLPLLVTFSIKPNPAEETEPPVGVVKAVTRRSTVPPG